MVPCLFFVATRLTRSISLRQRLFRTELQLRYIPGIVRLRTVHVELRIQASGMTATQPTKRRAGHDMGSPVKPAPARDIPAKFVKWYTPDTGYEQLIARLS